MIMNYIAFRFPFLKKDRITGKLEGDLNGQHIALSCLDDGDQQYMLSINKKVVVVEERSTKEICTALIKLEHGELVEQNASAWTFGTDHSTTSNASIISRYIEKWLFDYLT